MADMDIEEMKVAVRRALDKHELGAARAILNADRTELHVVLQREPLTMDRHLATAEIEQSIGKITQIQLLMNLSPADQQRLEQSGFVV